MFSISKPNLAMCDLSSCFLSTVNTLAFTQVDLAPAPTLAQTG